MVAKVPRSAPVLYAVLYGHSRDCDNAAVWADPGLVADRRLPGQADELDGGL